MRRRARGDHDAERERDEDEEQPFDEKDFLQYVSSFYGRVSVEDGTVRLASELLMVSDYQAQEAKL